MRHARGNAAAADGTGRQRNSHEKFGQGSMLPRALYVGAGEARAGGTSPPHWWNRCDAPSHHGRVADEGMERRQAHVAAYESDAWDRAHVRAGTMPSFRPHSRFGKPKRGCLSLFRVSRCSAQPVVSRARSLRRRGLAIRESTVSVRERAQRDVSAGGTRVAVDDVLL